MKIHRKINVFRGIVMRRLTCNIGKSTPKDIDLTKVEVKRVLISRPNDRLGNLLLITPLIQEVEATFPGCRIDLFVRGGLAPELFKNYSTLHRIIRLPKKPFKQLPQYIYKWLSIKKYRYDLVINVVKNSSSGRLSTLFATSGHKFFGDDINIIQSHSRHWHIARSPVYNFRNFTSRFGLAPNNGDAPLLNLKLIPEEKCKGEKILNEIVKNERKTICLFTYATGGKRFSQSWWETFYARLQQEYPYYNIIEVLPKENVSQIGFKAPTFYTKDIRELGAVIAATQLFIGADSGVMHLASAVQVPVIGLFSVTDINAYAPYGNNSVGLDTNVGTVNDWMFIIEGVLNRQLQKKHLYG